MAAGTNELEVAVFGGGCFWCTEAIFGELRGVWSVIPGYAGGRMKNPNYQQVSTGETGHAEVVKIEFDPKVITYRDLLSVFLAVHDPTTPSRQGADVGEQYRSIILYTTEAQKNEAEKLIKPPMVTELVPLGELYTAEEYHQKYFQKNPQAPYCQLVISPKLEKLRKQFSKFLK